MKKFTVADNGNPDGTAKDRDGINPGTLYKAEYYNDNIFNLFEFVQSQGYALIAGDISQLAKASKALYNPNYTYNTSAIATQSVNDIVRGSDGKYYEAQTDGINGDDPVGSVTGNWKSIVFDKSLEINSLISKTTPVDADELLIADSASTFSFKKLTWSNLKATLLTYFDTLYSRTTAIFGINQTWQEAEYTDTGATFTDGTPKYRVAGVTYTNTSGKPIEIMISVFSASLSWNITIDGLIVNLTTSQNTYATVPIIIPAGSTYSLNSSGTGYKWSELR